MRRFILLLLLFLVCATVRAEARQVVDMAGRTVEVPEHIERVVGSVAPVTWLLYALDPSLLAALNSSPLEADMIYLDPRMKRLPAIGAFGGTRGINRERLLALRPDLMVFWGWGQAAATARRAQQLTDWGVPVVFVDLDRVERYPEALRFLGNLLHREERAERLAAYGERVMAAVRAATADIPARERLRIYYAEGMDGLASEPEDSFHAELITLAGGINVHRGSLGHYTGHESLSLEQVLAYDPRILLVREKSFFERVRKDPRWRHLTAVREGKVWLIPDQPLNWFDRPPSFMRFLGLQWLAHRLYPRRYPLDLEQETRNFFGLFLGAVPDAELLNEIGG